MTVRQNGVVAPAEDLKDVFVFIQNISLAC